jgi:hypothetical protein
MSRTTSFQFTNTSVSSNKLDQVLLGLVSNYAVTTDVADTAVLNNKTAPVDAEEIVTFKTRNIPNVKTNLNIQNPAAVKAGVWYSVEVEGTLVTTDTSDPSYRVDYPSGVTIAFRHPKSGDITPTHIVELLARAVSALRNADGTWRIADLMRGSERPITD